LSSYIGEVYLNKKLIIILDEEYLVQIRQQNNEYPI